MGGRKEPKRHFPEEQSLETWPHDCQDRNTVKVIIRAIVDVYGVFAECLALFYDFKGINLLIE